MSCDNMKPYACGGSMNPNTVQNPCDRSLHFEGADDVTINQGVGIDLTEGVHAYDANGNEIEYTVDPDSIEKCEVGDHVITYTATGEGSRSVPTMCGETALYARACNIITEIKKRIITILQSANPIIRGLSDALIQPDETFAPLSGVTAEDANGNELTVSYSGRYTNTAEGDIATFDTPYAEPFVSLVADIDPIQDLHGYDSPWVGGGGVNKLDEDTFTSNGTFTKSNGVFSNASTDTRSYFSAVIRGYHSDDTFENLSITVFSATGRQSFPAFTPQADIVRISVLHSGSQINLYCNFDCQLKSGQTYIASLNIIGFNPQTVGGLSFDKIQIETGSTATAWTPYTNICPISGWDSVDVSVAGKNLFNVSMESTQVDPTRKYTLHLKPNTQYTMSTDVPYTSPASVYFNGGSSGTNGVGLNRPKTFTSDANGMLTVDIRTRAVDQSINAYDALLNGVYWIQLEEGDTATTYEAYTETTYTTTLPQTVYGGTLDVVSGVLTVDRAMADMGSLDWAFNGVIPNGYQYAAAISGKALGETNFICSAYTTGSPRQTIGYICGRAATTTVACNATEATLADFKTAVSGQQLCYELATPTTYQLTPTQIDSLLGRNSVWADSGDVTVWYVDEIPQSAFSYPVRGTYTITYTAEDECGNRTETDRTIQVGAETYRTVIYEDKTLIINEKSSDTEENERLHGRAEYVYDAMDNDHPYVFSSPEDIPWSGFSGYPERVEFGSEVHPTSTAYWFYGMNQVNTFDLTNLDTSNVTDMKYMFYDCQQIMNLAPEFDTSNVTDMSHMFERCIATPEIDVSSFDTSNVTDMSSMFASCYNLRAIYAKPTFVTDNVTSSNLMFGYDVHLVGGMGTPYDSNYEDSTYARIDDPPDEPGYFTQG